MKIKAATAVVLAALLASCASDLVNVIPKPDNRYDVISKARSEDDAVKSALSSAETTCKARNQRHVVRAQHTTYKGLVSEGANKMINTGASIISAMTLSVVPTLSSEDDYQVTMEFSCES